MHLDTQIDSRLGGDPGTEMPLWSTRDHATPEYVRNVDSWLSDVDMTFHSVWQSRDDVNERCANLITPDAFIATWHFRNEVGDTFRFVESDGTVHVATIAAGGIVRIGAVDLYIGRFEADLPASITPAKVPPANFEDYFEMTGSFLDTFAASAGLDQEDDASCRDLFHLATTTFLASFAEPEDAIRQTYYTALVEGDSSDPGFMIINGEVVILTTWESGGGGAGDPIHAYLTEIAAALVTAGSAHTVTIADLNKFRTY